MQTIIAEAVNYPDIPWLGIQASLSQLANLEKPLTMFAEVTK